MRAVGALTIIGLSFALGSRLAAQCPDGTPPPCKPAVTRSLSIDTNAVAIFPFHIVGSSNDIGWMREGGMDLLALGLEAIGSWRVLGGRTVLAHTTEFTERSPPAEASRNARSIGAGRVVLSRVVGTGPELVVTSELYDTRGARRLAVGTARGQAKDLAALVDSLATALVSQRMVLQGRRPSVVEYGTAKPLALRAYLAAEHLIRVGKWQAAADSLRKAIERDSTFEMAWYRLLLTGWWMRAETGFGGNFNTLIKGATRDTTRLPRRIGLVLLAIQAADRGERLLALRRADELMTLFPNDPDAVLAAADNYFHYGLASGESPERVFSMFQHALELDADVPEAYIHLAELHCSHQDTTRLWNAVAMQAAKLPDWPDGRVSRVALRAVFRNEDPAKLVDEVSDADMLARGGLLPMVALGCTNDDPARAIALADSFTAVVANSDRTRTLHVTATARRHDFFLARGQYKAAWAVLQKAAAVEPARFEVAGRIILHHLITGNRASEALEAARQLGGRDGSPVILLLWQRASAGLLDSADIQRVRTETFLSEDMAPYRAALIAGLRGLISLNAGDSVAARRELLRAYEVRYPSTIAAPWAKPDRRFTLALARLEYASGDLDAALRHLEDLGFPLGLLERAEAEELRGQIEEQRADTAAAVRAYRNFVALWQNADPELQPRVATASAALARLEHR